MTWIMKVFQTENLRLSFTNKGSFRLQGKKDDYLGMPFVSPKIFFRNLEICRNLLGGTFWHRVSHLDRNLDVYAVADDKLCFISYFENNYQYCRWHEIEEISRWLSNHYRTIMNDWVHNGKMPTEFEIERGEENENNED